MKYNLPEQADAIASQMDCQQSTVTYRQGNFESAVYLDEWKTARSTIAVELMLRRAVEQGPCLFKNIERRDRLGMARLNSQFHMIRGLLSRACPHLEYSPLLSRLIHTAHDLGLEFQPLTSPSDLWLPPGKLANPNFISQAKVFDGLLSRVSTEGRTPSVALETRRWRAQADADFRSATTYLDACLKDASKLFVLRMNLGDWGALLADGPRLPLVGDVQDIKRRFSRFAKELSREDPQAIIGYLSRLDFGPKKGFFYHVVILLRAAEARRAVDWCQRLGSRWVALSPEGQGVFTGCNWVFQDPAARIGLIDAGSTADRVAMERFVLSYLTLSSQYARVRLNARQRVFSRGTFPKEGA